MTSATPSRWRANLPADARYLLIAAQSGRALAQAARLAGYAPLVADLFSDLDTLGLAQRHALLPRDAEGGIAQAGFGAALAALSEGFEPACILGAVCGSGFEDRAELLDEAALHAPLLGNSAEITRGLKDPLRFAKLCQTFDIAHPTITYQPPREAAGWLAKRAGASGGAHVRAMRADEPAQPGRYFQRLVAGEAVSALFCGDGRSAQILGFSAQWTDPAPGAPFRYGGAAGPLQPAPALAAQMTSAVQSITRARRLRGLCSADFMVDGDLAWLLEINPRPGAALDVFDSAETPLLRHHLAGCAGALLPLPPPMASFRAAATVYARTAVASMPALDWPLWAADRQPPHSALTAGAPVCTVFGAGGTLEEARAAAAGRAAQIKKILDGDG